MKRTVVIGAGVTGASCARYLKAEAPTVIDTRPAPPLAQGLKEAGVDVRVGVERFDFSGYERAVVSPGVPLDACLVRAASAAGLALISDIDLFFEAAQAPVLAVTGTNGKSTVTSLAAALLRGLGVRAVAGGNLGDAALDVLDDTCEAYVLELSSFQLERLGAHPRAAAALLNVTSDHIDRHGDYAAYLVAKRRVFEGSQRLIFNRADPQTWPPDEARAASECVSFGLDAPAADTDFGVRDGQFCVGRQVLAPTSALRLQGAHNHANFLAACALISAWPIDTAALQRSAREFRGLPHRSELVAEHHNVRFVNDSKATNVGATLAAVQGLSETLPPTARIVLIAGGDGKGADFDDLKVLSPSLRGAVLIGADAPRLATVLSGAEFAPDMASAVRRAAALAQPGDVVLLSPACASFDMYANFEARGQDFARCVRELGT